MSEVVALKPPRSGPRLRIGFLRLTDSAPAIVAHEFGYFAEEGVDVELLEEPSWANIADKLAYGFLDAAVIIPPLAFAVELGLRGISQRLVIPCTISSGGNTVTLGSALARRLREKAEKEGLSMPQALAASLSDDRPLTLGVVHAYSTHNLLLRYWLATAGIHAGRDVQLSVVPPARAVEALASGQIAGFCAGAPWGEIAVRQGTGINVASSDDIWRAAPEKAFAIRERWADEHPEAVKGVVRALVRAGQFCDAPENASYTAALLSRQKYLGVDSHAILSSLPGGAITPDNSARFFRGATTFPWRSHALWFLEQMARWNLVGPVDAQALAARVYRSDLYRAAVAPLGISVPVSDSKNEGAHDAPWRLEASPNSILMEPDRFCDGAIFDTSPAPASF